MLELAIPGWDPIRLEYLLVDYNGTLAKDGKLLDGVAKRIHALAKRVEVHVATMDTFGRARFALDSLPVQIKILDDHDFGAKAGYLNRLGPGRTAAIGNGYNDAGILKAAVLSVCVIGPEGAAGEALRHAKIVVHDIRDALDLFLEPKRLEATLRR